MEAEVEDLLKFCEKRKHARIAAMGLDYPKKLIDFYDNLDRAIYEKENGERDRRCLQGTGQTFHQRQATVFAQEAADAMERALNKQPMRLWILLEFQTHMVFVMAYGFAHAVEEARFVGLNPGGSVQGTPVTWLDDGTILDHSYMPLLSENPEHVVFIESILERLPKEESEA
jgi:hypothetical protein